jgi:multisubunit Na+/H+ antiporter MnhF subunit
MKINITEKNKKIAAILLLVVAVILSFFIYRTLRINKCIDRVLAYRMTESERVASAICKVKYYTKNCYELKIYFNEKCSTTEKKTNNRN